MVWSRLKRFIGSCRFVYLTIIIEWKSRVTKFSADRYGKREEKARFILQLQNISNSHFLFFPQPIILAFSAKQLHGVGDRLATDVTTTANGIAQKPRNSVYEIFQFYFKRAFASVNSSFAQPHCLLLFRWGVRLRNNHVTVAKNKLENAFWRCSIRTEL